MNVAAHRPEAMLIRRAHLPAEPRVVDVRVADGRIAAIGPQLEAATHERIIEARGGALLPGLRDHHLHLAALAASLESVPCGPPTVTSARELQAVLSAETHGEGWLRGIGYHPSVAGDIDRDWIDRHLSRRPVRIQHRSGRLWILNSAALARLGPLGSDSPLELRRGLPTGRLYDADRWLRGRLARARPSLAEASRLLASRGFVGLCEVTPGNSVEDYEFLANSVARGELRQELRVMGGASLDDVRDRTGIRRGSTKIHLHENTLPDLEQLRSRTARSHGAGRPVAIHSTTVAELAVALEAIATAGPVEGDRIEHASVTPDELLPRIRELGLVVVTQPHFIRERGDQYRRDIPAEQWPWLYRGRAFREAGIGLAAGTDAPFGAVDPWVSMQCAVERRTLAGATLGAEEALSPEEALALYTGDLETPARAAQPLIVGSPADLCLIDRPWPQARQALAATRVLATVRAGRLIWSADPAAVCDVV